MLQVIYEKYMQVLFASRLQRNKQNITKGGKGREGSV